ncbi:MAG: class I SAM-dependent methyltransferase [Chlamydiae bacterium]|nr:class I SAM-dependent methyltransferase [Chlamydiota bacterium]
MTDLLTEQERIKYVSIWKINSYRLVSPGYNSANCFFNFFKEKIQPGDSITDFGCGTGITTLNFLEKQLSVQLIDIAHNALSDEINALTILLPSRVKFYNTCLWELSDNILPTDWIYCIDVLEHIPTEKIEACLIELSKRMVKGGAIQVFLEDEGFGKIIGEPLHLTIKPLSWWHEIISKFFDIKHIASVIPDIRYTFFVEPIS